MKKRKGCADADAGIGLFCLFVSAILVATLIECVEWEAPHRKESRARMEHYDRTYGIYDKATRQYIPYNEARR